MRSSSLQCVFIPNVHQTREGLGAIMHRNQIAMFIATLYNAKVEYHGMPSEHGYDINKMFDKCPGPPLPIKEDSLVQQHPCTLDVSHVFVPMCDYQDCSCRASAISPHVEKLVAKGCSSIIVRGDGFKDMTFSACLKPILERYFGWKGPKPTWEYDVIHYRMGDLADAGGGKTFAPSLLQTYVNIMCKSSDRDIIILTEGNPDVPRCEDRVILAADTSVKEAMQVMQFAKTVAVGKSEFATLMLMMANPEAVIMRSNAFVFYDWLDVDDWYLVESDYAVVRFPSKELARRNMQLHLNLRTLKFRHQKENDLRVDLGKATRRWNVTMMK